MTQGTFRDGPRVVVGIDGSTGATAAAEFAVREARLRGARLVAVTALGLADAAHFDPYSVHMHTKMEIVFNLKIMGLVGLLYGPSRS